MPALINK